MNCSRKTHPDKAKEFTGKVRLDREQREKCSATWLTASGLMVMGLVSTLSLANHLACSHIWSDLRPPDSRSWLIGKDWCWEGLGAGGEGNNRGWDGWMASPTQWTWVWVKSGSWWWTGRPGVLRFMGSQRVRHDYVTELNWTEPFSISMGVDPLEELKDFVLYGPWEGTSILL